MELFHILTASFFCCFLPLITLIMRVPTVSGSAVTPQNCTTASSTSCQAMVGYVPVNNLQLSEIASLFSLNYTSILGPNDFNLSLPGLESVVVPAGKVYMVPQTCGCVNGTRAVISTNYTVKSGDTLSKISDQYYSQLVTYQQIGIANNISNLNLILPGQSFLIPIPCGCPSSIINGSAHELLLSYQIQKGDTLSSIAGNYNTTTNLSQLEQLNSLSANSTLTASDVLFVPFPVCQAANFSTNALDKNLTVAEGTYKLTANNCVQCRCNNGTLHCTPTPSSFGASCSNMTCPGSTLTLGNSTASLQGSSGCSVQSCVYMGYNESGIISKLETEVDPTCPAPPPPETVYNPPNGLVASPLGSPTVTTPSPPPPPTPSVASTPSSPTANTTPNSASLLLAGDQVLSGWWLLLVLGLCLWVPSLAL